MISFGLNQQFFSHNHQFFLQFFSAKICPKIKAVVLDYVEAIGDSFRACRETLIGLLEGPCCTVR
jgi:hypothetical protein